MIENLIFDFGNVWVDLNEKAGFDALRKLGFSSFSKEMVTQNQSYEKGEIHTEEHFQFYQKFLPDLRLTQFHTAWNSILSPLSTLRYEFAKTLADQKQYNLYVLSNTSALHTNWFVQNDPLYKPFKKLFKKFYRSHELGMRKPNRAVFEFLITENAIQPERSLFIDDLSENTATARDLGFLTWTLNPQKEDICDLFQKKEFFR